MAKGTAFKKLEAKTLASRARARTIARAALEQQQHTLVTVGSAFGLGWSRRNKFKIPTFPGVTPSASIGITSLLLAYFIRDKQAKRILEGVADGMLSIAGYKAGADGFGAVFSTGQGGMAVGGGWGEEIVEEGSF